MQIHSYVSVLQWALGQERGQEEGRGGGVVDQVSSCFHVSKDRMQFYCFSTTTKHHKTKSRSFRDEDRDILIALKTKGASRETFSTLAEKLNKPSGQVSRRSMDLNPYGIKESPDD